MNKSQFKALEKKVAELEEVVRFYKTRCQNIEQSYNQLVHHFKEFQRQRFGSKSERYTGADSPQEDLFAEKKSLAPSETSPEEMAPEIFDDDNVISVAAYKRKKNKEKGFPKHLPRREIIIPAGNRLCPCGCTKGVIRYEEKERLNYQPAIWEVIVEKREVVACQKGCAASIHTAEAPKRLLPKVQVTETSLAHIVVSKFDDRQPLYHLEKQFKSRADVMIGRNQMARWVIKLAFELQPIINLLKDTILDYDIAAVDPTSLQVLKEPGRNPSTKSYLYCMRGGPPDKQVCFYEYNATEHKNYLSEWFDGFRGYLMCDGQNIFDVFESSNDITLLYCNIHARRYFEKITKQQKTKTGLAHQAMRFYRRIYKMERIINAMDITAEMRKAYRLEKMKDLFDQHFKWMKEQYPTVLTNTPIGKALDYSINREAGLMRFFDDGRLPLDNNDTEQFIKYIIMARRNFLFSHSTNGAIAVGHHMTLIQTAKLHSIDPYHYLLALLREMPHCNTLDDFEALLPWNIRLTLPEQQFLKIA
jgi:transposase